MKNMWFSSISTPEVAILKRIWNTWTGRFSSRFTTLMEKKSEPTICSNGFILFMEKKPMCIFPTNPDGVHDQRLRFHIFHTGRMAIRRKAKLKNRNLFFHMLPAHLRSPAKETKAKACLTESSKSPASITWSNKQWVGTCLYQEWYKPLLISCEAAIRLWVSSEADCEYPLWQKAFLLAFVTIQIHAKRKKGTGLLQWTF